MNAIVHRLRWLSLAQTPTSAIAYSLMSRISIFVINISTGIFVARMLGPEGRGATGAINLWMLLIPGLLTLGVPAALRYEIRRKRASTKSLFSCALILTGSLGLAACVIGVMIIPLVLAKYSANVALTAQFMMIFAPLNLWNTTIQAFFESQGDFRRSNSIIYLPPIGTLLGMIILFSIHRVSPYSFALMYPLPIALITLTTILKLRNYLCIPSDFIARSKSLLQYGLRAYGIDIITALSAQIEQALVVGLLSATSFGYYAVAIAASAVLSLPVISLNVVLFPTASGLEPEKAIALVNRSARLVSAFTLLSALFVITALPVFVPIAYGRSYLPIVGVTQVLCVGIVMASIATVLAQAFMATGRPEIATYIQAARVVFALPLMLLFVPRLGLTGAAYGVVIANTIRLVLALIAFPIFLGRPMPRLVLTSNDLGEIRVFLARLTRRSQ